MRVRLARGFADGPLREELFEGQYGWFSLSLIVPRLADHSVVSGEQVMGNAIISTQIDGTTQVSDKEFNCKDTIFEIEFDSEREGP